MSFAGLYATRIFYYSIFKTNKIAFCRHQKMTIFSTTYFQTPGGINYCGHEHQSESMIAERSNDYNYNKIVTFLHIRNDLQSF